MHDGALKLYCSVSKPIIFVHSLISAGLYAGGFVYLYSLPPQDPTKVQRMAWFIVAPFFLLIILGLYVGMVGFVMIVVTSIFMGKDALKSIILWLSLLLIIPAICTFLILCIGVVS